MISKRIWPTLCCAQLNMLSLSLPSPKYQVFLLIQRAHGIMIGLLFYCSWNHDFVNCLALTNYWPCIAGFLHAFIVETNLLQLLTRWYWIVGFSYVLIIKTILFQLYIPLDTYNHVSFYYRMSLYISLHLTHHWTRIKEFEVHLSFVFFGPTSSFNLYPQKFTSLWTSQDTLADCFY